MTIFNIMNYNILNAGIIIKTIKIIKTTITIIIIKIKHRIIIQIKTKIKIKIKKIWIQNKSIKSIKTVFIKG